MRRQQTGILALPHVQEPVQRKMAQLEIQGPVWRAPSGAR